MTILDTCIDAQNLSDVVGGNGLHTQSRGAQHADRVGQIELALRVIGTDLCQGGEKRARVEISAVSRAARVPAAAGAEARRDRAAVVGSGIAFEERGTQTLKGVPGEWNLLSVVPAEAAEESPEVKLAKLDTPGPREFMRRGDRFASVLARRAPSVLRAANRLETRRQASRQAT